MSDDKSRPSGEDRSRISLLEDYEVRYRAASFEVTEQALSSAVARVGHKAKAVHREFGGRR